MKKYYLYYERKVNGNTEIIEKFFNTKYERLYFILKLKGVK